MVLNIDIAATILAAAEIELADAIQGRSLMPLVHDEQVDDWRTEMFCEHLMNHRDIPKWEGVRNQRYVYARYFEQEPVYEFLHDLKSDPRQRRNFATDSAYRKTLSAMRIRCDTLRDQYATAKPVSKNKPTK